MAFTPAFQWSPELRSIWRYSAAYTPNLGAEHWITLDEGCTPLSEFPELARQLRLDRLWLKREDLNPNGSQKDRCAAYQVSWARANGHRLVTISSSGNAALSTAAYCARAGIHLIAQLSPQTNPIKVQRMLNFGATVVTSPEPIRFARYLERVYGIPNLRPSTSPIATQGYRSIGYELIEAEPAIDALFLYASSASTLVGIGEALRSYRESNPEFRLPQLHAVQAGLVNSLATEWGIEITSAERSIVGDLGAKKTRRTFQALDMIRESGGAVWYVRDEEILGALERLRRCGVDSSYEGAATLAGAAQAGWSRRLDQAVCLLTGQGYPEIDLPLPDGCLSASNFEDLDRIVASLSAIPDSPRPGA